MVQEILRIVGIAKQRVAEIDEVVKKAVAKANVKLQSQVGY